MTRSGAPFHGAHGEGRTAISPAASQAGAEPCARAFPAARARRNAPVISDNAVVAAPMNWRAESTGNPLPLSRSATQLAAIMAKVDRPPEMIHSAHETSVAAIRIRKNAMPSFCVQQHDRERDGPFPRDFGDGKPQYIFLPPGMLTLMVKRVIDGQTSG